MTRRASLRGGVGAAVVGLVVLVMAACGSGTSKTNTAGAPESWTSAVNMRMAREGGGAGLGTWSARLPDGRVLVAGGYGTNTGKFDTDAQHFQKMAEIYDPTSGKWAPAASMNQPRFGGAVVALPKSGLVLAAGGTAGSNAVVSPSAEVFDPRAGAWRFIAPMSTCRVSPATSVLPSGDVLLTGGIGCDGAAQSSAEIYRAATGEWTLVAPMHQPRWGHSATILPDGRVLVAGGRANAINQKPEQVVASAEVYDPVHDSWAPAASMRTPRVLHAAALLSSGEVIVAGGHSQDPDDAHSATATSELYDPRADTWSATGDMHAPREEGGSLLLGDGTFLVAGGGQQTSAEIYNPANGTWKLTGSMRNVHDDAQLVGLANGDALIAGGFRLTTDNYYNTATAELYHPPKG